MSKSPSLKDLGVELEDVSGLTEPTVDPEPTKKHVTPTKPVKEEKKEELVRLTIRIEPELEERLVLHQRRLRKQGKSKRESCFNAIIIEAIEYMLARDKGIKRILKG